ncbi:MAG: VWA domain-containing protein [Gammaproteobacteria bacterium]
MNLDVTLPLVLGLLPAALLPWFRHPLRSRAHPHLGFVPPDALSSAVAFALRVAGSGAIAALVLGIAGLHRTEQQIERTGRGAHIVMVFDRSSSMDSTFAGRAPTGAEESKSGAARRLLSEFVAGRHEDLFGTVFFSTQPMAVLPLTDHREAVEASIAAIDAPGLAYTNVAKGLLAGLSYFAHGAVTGSRVLLLVSDGAAVVDFRSQALLRTLFNKHRVALYWVYLRTDGSPGLDDRPEDARRDTPQSMPERHLHQFFQTLGRPYRAFQADSPSALASAIAEIDRLENLPLSYHERVPRQPLQQACFAAAAVLIALLCTARLLERELHA